MLAALGRLLARRARWFVACWLVLVALGFAAAAGALGGEGLFARLESGDAPQVASESREGQRLLNRTATSGPAVQLLLDRVDPAAPEVARATRDAAERLRAVPGVQAVLSPFEQPAATPATPATQPTQATPFVARDGRAVLVVVQLRRGLDPAAQDTAEARVGELLAAVDDAVPGSVGTVGGVSALVDEINEQVNEDLRTGETIALPLSLLVMVLVFGGLLAAGLPVVGAIASIAGALATLLGFSYVIDLDSTVVSVVSVLGLGLCIDYGLLLVSRFREELRAGPRVDRGRAGSPQVAAALERTLATAGRTVLFSAVTVAVSLAGLLFFDATILRAVGAAGVSVVVVALLVALTLVPALVALAGERLVRPGVTHRVPLLRRFARRLGDVAPDEGVFSRLALRVQRRPLVVVLGVLLVLGIAASPALGLRLVSSGEALLPASSTQRQLFEAVAERFPAVAPAPVTVVARADPAAGSTSPADALRAWAPTVEGLPGVASAGPVTERGSGADRVAVLEVRTTPVPGAAGAADDRSRDLVAAIRAVRPAGVQTYVTGQAALVADFVAGLKARAPLAAGVVVLATFLLLFLMTGSVLVPLKALLMNVVSLGACFGVLVWVFQEGHLESLLGFTATGGIETAIPALVLAFGFGLAMDYEVFLLARIKEFRDAGAGNDEAVVRGLQRSGRIITSAALIVVLVFSGFVAGQLLVIKETGVSLAVAVAIDATLVRMLLVPATMTLLGEWNWWAPAPLRRLHRRFGVSEHAPDVVPHAS